MMSNHFKNEALVAVTTIDEEQLLLVVHVLVKNIYKVRINFSLVPVVESSVAVVEIVS